MIEKKKKMLVVRISEELHYELKKYALEKKKTVQQIVIELLKRDLESNK